MFSPVYNRWYYYELYGWIEDLTSFEVAWSQCADVHMKYVPTHPPIYSMKEIFEELMIVYMKAFQFFRLVNFALFTLA